MARDPSLEEPKSAVANAVLHTLCWDRAREQPGCTERWVTERGGDTQPNV